MYATMAHYGGSNNSEAPPSSNGGGGGRGPSSLMPQQYLNNINNYYTNAMQQLGGGGGYMMRQVLSPYGGAAGGGVGSIPSPSSSSSSVSVANMASYPSPSFRYDMQQPQSSYFAPRPPPPPSCWCERMPLERKGLSRIVAPLTVCTMCKANVHACVECAVHVYAPYQFMCEMCFSMFETQRVAAPAPGKRSMDKSWYCCEGGETIEGLASKFNENSTLMFHLALARFGSELNLNSQLSPKTLVRVGKFQSRGQCFARGNNTISNVTEVDPVVPNQRGLAPEAAGSAAPQATATTALAASAASAASQAAAAASRKRKKSVVAALVVGGSEIRFKEPKYTAAAAAAAAAYVPNASRTTGVENTRRSDRRRSLPTSERAVAAAAAMASSLEQDPTIVRQPSFVMRDLNKFHISLKDSKICVYRGKKNVYILSFGALNEPGCYLKTQPRSSSLFPDFTSEYTLIPNGMKILVLAKKNWWIGETSFVAGSPCYKFTHRFASGVESAWEPTPTRAFENAIRKLDAERPMKSRHPENGRMMLGIHYSEPQRVLQHWFGFEGVLPATFPQGRNGVGLTIAIQDLIGFGQSTLKDLIDGELVGMRSNRTGRGAAAATAEEAAEEDEQ